MASDNRLKRNKVSFLFVFCDTKDIIRATKMYEKINPPVGPKRM